MRLPDFQTKKEIYRTYELEANSNKPPVDISYNIDFLASASIGDYLSFRKNKSEVPNFSMLELFIVLKNTFATGATSWTVRARLIAWFNVPNSMDLITQDALSELASRKLVDISHVQKAIFDKMQTEKHFTLSEHGKNLLMYASMDERYSKFFTDTNQIPSVSDD
jgi:hypothetical protein